MNSRSGLVLLGAVFLAVPSLAGCSIADPQRALTLQELVNSDSQGSVDVTTQPEENTEIACAASVDCVESYSTTEANYFRFESKDRAKEFGDTLQDGFTMNYIVMDFAGKDASVEHQLWAMQELAGTWNDYEGDFPDRR
ncbi:MULTISPECIES: hypothetical protein [unclassified Glutamicibacter]|uniref:hypothetical protein n=1 Tax=unclassified Glutamicibacter TaxID=2627139 RepID=UPI0021C8AC7C|nr:hypothetical protein [Glutamicibacter sp. M10]UXN32992.1 hypothetical protein N6V40_06050 [Glutamicibacter sp. M10]